MDESVLLKLINAPTLHLYRGLDFVVIVIWLFSGQVTQTLQWETKLYMAASRRAAGWGYMLLAVAESVAHWRGAQNEKNKVDKWEGCRIDKEVKEKLLRKNKPQLNASIFFF